MGKQLTYRKLLKLHNHPAIGNASIYCIDASIIGGSNAKGKR